MGLALTCRDRAGTKWPVTAAHFHFTSDVVGSAVPDGLAETVGMEYIASGGLERGQQIGTGRAATRRTKHAPLRVLLRAVKKEVTQTLSIGERQRGEYKCPGCGGKKLQPLMGTFFSQTSRKS